MSLIGKCSFDYIQLGRKEEECNVNKPEFIKEITSYSIDVGKVPVGSLVLVTFQNTNDIMNAMKLSIDVMETIKSLCTIDGEVITFGGTVSHINDHIMQIFTCVDNAHCYSEIPLDIILNGKVCIEVIWKPEAKDTELFYGHKKESDSQ